MPIESDCSSLARGLLKYIKPVIMCTRPLRCSSHILFLRLLRWLCSGNLLWQPATDYNISRDRWLPNMLYAYNRYPITITVPLPFLSSLTVSPSVTLPVSPLSIVLHTFLPHSIPLCLRSMLFITASCCYFTFAIIILVDDDSLPVSIPHPVVGKPPHPLANLSTYLSLAAAVATRQPSSQRREAFLK